MTTDTFNHSEKPDQKLASTSAKYVGPCTYWQCCDTQARHQAAAVGI